MLFYLIQLLCLFFPLSLLVLVNAQTYVILLLKKSVQALSIRLSYHLPLVSQRYWRPWEHLKSFHFPAGGNMCVQSSFPPWSLGSPLFQWVYLALDPSTHIQRELSLGSLCKPIHTFCDIFDASACCSACDVTMASLEPIASQADFATFQFVLPDETL